MTWLGNEDYEGTGGLFYSSGYTPPNWDVSPFNNPTPAYNNPLVNTELQDFSASIYTPPAPPAPAIEQTTGVKPMGYYYGNSGGYSGYNYFPPQQYVNANNAISDITYGGNNPGVPSGDTPDLPGYVNAPTPVPNIYNPDNSLPIEQVTSTAENPYGAYTGPGVTVTPSPLANRYAPYTGGYVPVTPEQISGQSANGGGSPSPGGGTGGGSSGGGQGPQPQQKQQPQSPVNIFNILGKSGSGQAGGNTGALYNPNKQGGYGAGNQYGSQSGANAGAGYNAPSIVPYLLIGGLGLLAYEMLKGKHHG